MSTINISLPESLREFVITEAAIEGYSTLSEYVRGLIRKAQKEKLEERLALLLLEGLESGQPIPAEDVYWDAKRAALEAD
jgi:antitoxin ParD1/3/4